MLLKHRRYSILLEQLPSGSWRASMPAMLLAVANPNKTVAKHQLKLKINRALKVIERGKAELPDSDASDDNLWWDVRIMSRKSVHL